MAIGIATAVGSASAALRVAHEPRCDFDYEPRRPPPIAVLRSLKQRHEPSMQAPHADRLPSPRSPTEQSEHAPLVRSCSQAGDDDWGCNNDSTCNGSAADAEEEYARADDGDSSDGRRPTVSANLQAMHERDCTRCVYANACAAHNVKLLGNDCENFED